MGIGERCGAGSSGTVCVHGYSSATFMNTDINLALYQNNILLYG